MSDRGGMMMVHISWNFGVSKRARAIIVCFSEVGCVAHEAYHSHCHKLRATIMIPGGCLCFDADMLPSLLPSLLLPLLRLLLRSLLLLLFILSIR